MSATPSNPVSESPARGAWPLLAVLTGFNLLNFVDRQLIAALAPLLKPDLGLTRADIGLLAGFAFVAIYTVVGLVMGLAADRWSRRLIIALGLALWSAMTAASGAARSFGGLALPRLFVGVGEAALAPAAMSLIADMFPARRRGMASSVYYIGLPLGTAGSLIAAGWAGPRFGWRACFFALGAIGLAATTLLAFVREPARVSAHTRTDLSPTLGRIVSDLSAALRARPAMLWLMLGGAGLAYASASAMLGVTWLVQERGFPYARAAYVSGLVAVAAGFAGTLAGGWFSDWCHARWAGGRAWSLAIMAAAFAPFSLAFYTLTPASPLFYVCWFVSSASTVAYFGPVYTAVQELAPDHARASAVAVGLLVLNLAGVGPGPWITGLIGDAISLTQGLVVSVAVSATAVVPFVVAARLTPGRRGAAAPSA
jgi:MFS family permease